MSALIAYPGGAAQKEALVASLEAHAAADRMVAEHFWRDVSGCSVACALQSLCEPNAATQGDHAALGKITGYGETLAMIQDAIFEGLPDGERQQFSIAFHKAIPVGADVSLVGWQFLDRLLSRLFNQTYAARVADACQAARDFVAAKARGQIVSVSVENSAFRAAAKFDYVTMTHAERNAVAAICSAVDNDGRSAAWAAANAASDAEIAKAVAQVYAVEDAYAAADAMDKEYRAQAADLLKLLASAPVPNTEDEQ